eukprot:m.256510 g.256510  ORF g.256510 m.256510 type:complete len:643 (-) comp34425_c0_seq1:252-2180(-)
MRDLTEADAPRPPQGIENIIIIDCVPSVSVEKVDRLKKVLQKIFLVYGEVVRIELPMDNGKGTGYCFIEFASKDQALLAKANHDGFPLDRKHKFIINNMSDFDGFLNTPDVWESKSDEEFDEKEHLTNWLMHTHTQDQFVIRHDMQTEIHWCRKNDSAVSYAKSKWTDEYVAWSPQGSYLASFHRQGVRLWGGKNWAPQQRFPHGAVKLIDFSPNEKYMVTWSNETRNGAVIVWDVKTGENMREFAFDENPSWPALKWSYDDKYVARMKEDNSAILIYETPSMLLLEKKPVKIPSVQNFEWSPTDNLLSFWIPEENDKPASVNLMSIPEREVIKSANIFMVKECKMSWQKSGDHVCVSVERWTKSKKQTFTQFMLFHTREKLIAVDTVEVKEKILHFAWEPVGSKFAVVFEESGRISLSVYVIANGKVTLLKTIDRITANALFWSPRGRYLVVAGLGHLQGVLEFIDTHDMSTMSTGEHFMASEVQWDPSGRFIISSVATRMGGGTQSDTGYYVWSFQGKLLQKVMLDKFLQIAWRPRPPTLLSEAKIREVSKSLKKYESDFKAEDEMQTTKASVEVKERRRNLAAQWNKHREASLAKLAIRAATLSALRPAVESEMATTDIMEKIEVFVEEKTEVLEVKIK